MKIENIRLFLDVVRYGSINKAAEKNFIAQQNLSVTIKNMEKELGHTLLERTNAGITLTENGHNFYQCAEKIIASYDEYLNISAPISENNIIPIYSTLALSKCLADLSGHMIDDKYYLSLNERSYKEIKQMIRDREEGLFFIAVVDENILQMQKMPNASFIAKESETLFFCHKTSQLSRQKFTAEQLSGQMSVSLLSQNSLMPGNMINVGTVEAAKKLMIERGFYCSLPFKLKRILGFDDPDEWIDLVKNRQTYVAYYVISGKNIGKKYQNAQDYISSALKQKFAD